jgi:hypothetical protein
LLIDSYEREYHLTTFELVPTLRNVDSPINLIKSFAMDDTMDDLPLTGYDEEKGLISPVDSEDAEEREISLRTIIALTCGMGG